MLEENSTLNNIYSLYEASIFIFFQNILDTKIFNCIHITCVQKTF